MPRSTTVSATTGRVSARSNRAAGRIEEVICDVCGGAASSQNLDDWQHATGRHHREALRRRVAEGSAAPGDADLLAVLDAEAKAQGVD